MSDAIKAMEKATGIGNMGGLATMMQPTQYQPIRRYLIDEPTKPYEDPQLKLARLDEFAKHALPSLVFLGADPADIAAKAYAIAAALEAERARHINPAADHG